MSIVRSLVILMLLCSVSHAEPVEPRKDLRKWHLGIEAMTDFPLQVGGQVWVELPHRIRLSTSFGELPDTYLLTINKVAVAAGAYGQPTAELITEALDRALTWRLHVGWRPFPRRGAYFELGFGTMSVNAGLALAPVIQAATTFPIPNVPSLGFGLRIKTVVETVGGEVGWIWYPWRDLTIRLSIGVAVAVDAQVSIRPKVSSGLPSVVTRFAESYTEEMIKRYLIIPTVGLAMGWRLF